MEDLGVSLGVSRGLRTGLSLVRGGHTSGCEASEAQDDVKLHCEVRGKEAGNCENFKER